MKSRLFFLISVLSSLAYSQPSKIELPKPSSVRDDSVQDTARRREGQDLVYEATESDCQAAILRPSYRGRLVINAKKVDFFDDQASCRSEVNVVRVEDYFPADISALREALSTHKN